MPKKKCRGHTGYDQHTEYQERLLQVNLHNSRLGSPQGPVDRLDPDLVGAVARKVEQIKRDAMCSRSFLAIRRVNIIAYGTVYCSISVLSRTWWADGRLPVDREPVQRGFENDPLNRYTFLYNVMLSEILTHFKYTQKTIANKSTLFDHYHLLEERKIITMSDERMY